MSQVFISYRRRGDSAAGYVHSLRDRLFRRYGRKQVFRDVDRIEYRDDFVQLIKAELEKCRACVVWIDPEWTTCADERGRRRLDDPDDLVRFEVATALQRQVAVPVLAGAAPLKSEDLPDDLRPLAHLNALEVRPAHFDRDVDALVQVLDRMVVGPPWIPALITTIAWMVPQSLIGPFFVAPYFYEDRTALLTPYLISGTVAGLGFSVALYRMRRDVSRVALGLLCAVWMAAWAGVARAVEVHGLVYVHPVEVFPGGIYAIATAIGCLGGFGTAAVLWAGGLLTGRRRQVEVALSWAGGCVLSAVILNAAARYWSVETFYPVKFILANALAGTIAGGIGAAVTFLALYRHATAPADPAG